MTIQQLFMSSSGGIDIFNITLSTNQTNYNLLNVLTAAPYNYNNTSPAIINLTINSGVMVDSSSTGTAALVTGAITSNASLNIINNGSIKGKGGAGGRGGDAVWSSADAGLTGSAGGTAFNISSSLSGKVTITNGSGEIFGGGGGGGGGNGASFFSGSGKSQVSNSVGGSGGGGGAGVGAGGAAGIGSGADFNSNGNAGSAGTTTTGGAGGSSVDAGIGGNGGGFGAAGSAGTPGAAGGAAGKAIELNGGSAPTFISGNDSTHVKGAVS